MNNSFELGKLDGAVDKISNVISTFGDKLKDLKDKILGPIDKQLEKLLGFKLFEDDEVKKETQEDLTALKEETLNETKETIKTELSTYYDELKDKGISEDLIKKEKKKMEALIDDPNNKDISKTVEQIKKDMKEMKETLDANISDDEIGMIEKISKKLLKKSPLSPVQIWAIARKWKIDINWLIAVAGNDSTYGTAGVAVETHNAGNVGNTGGTVRNHLVTRYNGLDKIGKNLSARRDAYKDQFDGKEPTIKELVENRGPEGIGFYSSNIGEDSPYRNEGGQDLNPAGAYMEDKNGPQQVENLYKQRENIA